LPPKDHKPHPPNPPPELEATLVVTQGPQRGLRYRMTRPEVRIGRRKDMDLMLSDATVSSEHARVFIAEGGLWIEDLRSLNGTLVNDRRIRRAALQSKDKITLGKYVLEVEMESPAPIPLAEETARPAPAGDIEAQAGFQQVWLAGFPPPERQALVGVVEQVLAGHATAFGNAEQILIELSARLSEGKGPDLIILNTRMPLISGPNAAISIRAFEEGFERPRKIPIGFFGTFPFSESESLQRILKFCNPASYMESSPNLEEFRKQATIFIKAITKQPV
jgi:pSer/pThr/pTyr-binding forkhead associated (FHA) protein